MTLPELFPGMPKSDWEKDREERERERKRREGYVVPTQLLNQGRTEAAVSKAQNLVPVQPTPQDASYGDLRGAMNGVGRDLQDNQVQKDPAWWQKALGVLEPLKYFDIPIELLAEAVFDPLEAMAEGTQFSWARGSAERENFEGWKALFGSGQGSLKERADKAAAAFEKRPLKMQLGLGAIQAAATFGAGGLAKGLSSGGSFAGRFGAHAVKATGYAVDPLEIGFKGLGIAGKPVFKLTRRGVSTAWDEIKYRNVDPEALKTEQTSLMGEASGILSRTLEEKDDATFWFRVRALNDDTDFPLMIDEDEFTNAITDVGALRRTVKDAAAFLSEDGQRQFRAAIDKGDHITYKGRIILHNEQDGTASLGARFGEGDLAAVNTPFARMAGVAFGDQPAGAAPRDYTPTTNATINDSMARHFEYEAVPPRDEQGNIIEDGRTPQPLSPKFGTIESGTQATYRVPGRSAQRNLKNQAWDLPPVLARGNEFQRLFGGLWSRAKKLNTGEILTKEAETESLIAMRDLALMQLQLSMASRPGAIARASLVDLRIFAQTGALKVKAGVGERSGMLTALDGGEAQDAVSNYLMALDNYRGGRLKSGLDDIMQGTGKGSSDVIMDETVQSAFAIDFERGVQIGLSGKDKNVLQVNGQDFGLGVIKSYRGGDNILGESFGITENARAIRNQKVSEMWLAEQRPGQGGAILSRLMRLLGHSNVEITRGYIHDIDVYFGLEDAIGSEYINIVKQANAPYINASLDTRKLIGERVQDMRDEARRIEQLEEAQPIKGKKKGFVGAGAEHQMLALEVGELYMRNGGENLNEIPETLAGFMDSQDVERYMRMIDDNDLLDPTILDDGAEILKLEALRNLKLSMEEMHTVMDTKRLGISSGSVEKWYHNVSTPGNSDSATTKGKLQRAGIDIGKDGKLKFYGGKANLGDDGIHDWAAKRRQDYAEEVGFAEHLGKYDADGYWVADEEAWLNWAQDLADERVTIGHVIDDNLKIGVLKKDGTFGKSRHLLHEVLGVYIDAKVLKMDNDWARNTHALGKDRNSVKWLDEKIHNVMALGSGRVDLTKQASSGGNFVQAQNWAYSKIRTTNILNPFASPTGSAAVRAIDPFYGREVAQTAEGLGLDTDTYNFKIPVKPEGPIEEALVKAYNDMMKGLKGDSEALREVNQVENLQHLFEQARNQKIGREGLYSELNVKQIGDEVSALEAEIRVLYEESFAKYEGIGDTTHALLLKRLNQGYEGLLDFENNALDEYIDDIEGMVKGMDGEPISRPTLRWADGLTPDAAARVQELRMQQLDLVSDRSMASLTKKGFLDMSYVQKGVAIERWVHEEQVARALKLAGISKYSSAEQINRRLKTLALKKPEVFGENFKAWSHDKVGGKMVFATRGVDMIDEIANRISMNRAELLRNFESGSKNAEGAVEAAVKGRKAMHRLRYSIDVGKIKGYGGMEGSRGFMPEDIAGVSSYQTVNQTMERIGTSRLGQWILKQEAGPMPFITRNVIAPTVAAFTGGKAAIARPVAKYISARNHLHAKADRDAVDVGIIIRQMVKDKLGIKNFDATDQLRAIDIMEGNEFFSALTLQDLDDIRQFEALDAVKAEYHGRYAGDIENVTPLKLIENLVESRNLEGFTTEGVSDGANMLKQVDVVLERINPQHWDKYFKLDDDTRGALLWIKELQNQIDQTARDRGVDIVGKIRDRGGEYLTNYFPRIFRKGRARKSLTERGPNEAKLDSNAKFFEQRNQKDILGQLTVGLQEGRMFDEDVLRRTVMEPIDQRLANYYSTMVKEAIDEETKEALLDMKTFTAAKDAKARYATNMRAIDATERVLNARLSGEEVVDMRIGERILGDGIDTSITQEFGWLLDANPQQAISRAARDEATVRKTLEDLRRSALGFDEGLQGGDVFRSDVTANHWMNGILKQLSPKDQRAIQEQLTVMAPTVLKPLEWIGRGLYEPTQVLRTLKAGLDVGAPLIHGYNSLVRLPLMSGKEGRVFTQGKWKEATKQMLNFVAHPDHLDAYIVNNYALRQRAGHWIKMGHTEPLAAVQEGQFDRVKQWFIKNYPNASEAIKLADRFESGFVGYTDVLRLELFKGFEPSIKRGLKDMGISDEAIEAALVGGKPNKHVTKAYHEMGAVINKMTGVMDRELAMTTPFQQLMESSLLFFAPMYRRATWGILGDLRRGGMRRDEAINQLSGVIGAGVMMGALAEMSGNNERAFLFDEEGNPDLTARFGKFNVAGAQVGVGTAWWTVFRTASDLAMMSYGGREGENVEQGGFLENPIFQMLGRRGRSQMAPGAGILTDLVQGRTFMGDPLRDAADWHWGAIGRNLGSQAIPFWLDGATAAFDGNFAGAGVMMASEAIGLTGYEISAYDHLANAREVAVESWEDPELDKWRQLQESKGREVNWVSLPRLLQQKIEDEHDTVMVHKTKYEEEYGPLATGNNKLFRAYRDKKSQLDKQAMMLINNAAIRFEKGEIDGRTFSQQISAAKLVRREGNTALLKSDEYKPLKDWFSTLRTGRSKADKGFQGDLLYDQWQAEVVHNAANIDDDGNFNFENFKLLESRFMEENRVDPEWRNYLEERRNAWLGDSPVVREFEEAKDKLEPYWKVHDAIWTPGTSMNREATRFMALPRATREQYKQAYPKFRDIDKKIREARDNLRKRRPDLDLLLSKWYGAVPKHQRNVTLLASMERDRSQKRIIAQSIEGAHPWATPKPSWLEISPSGRVTVDRTRDTRLTGTY